MTTASKIKVKDGSAFQSLLDICYPVGSIYQSTKSTNPGTFLGGTWTQLKDRFLLGAGSKAAGATGGEENHTLTVAEMPSHNHSGTTDEIKYGTNWNPGNDWSYSVASSATFSQYRSLIINSTGGGLLTTTCLRTGSCTCGSALHRGDSLCRLSSRAEAISKPIARSRWEGSTSVRPTSRRLPFGRERLGRASLRARSSYRAEGARPGITPSARPEALPLSCFPFSRYRRTSILTAGGGLPSMPPAEMRRRALRTATTTSRPEARASSTPAAEVRMRTGRPTSPSICGRELHKEAVA